MAESASVPASERHTWMGPWLTVVTALIVVGMAWLCRALGWSFLTSACFPLLVLGLLLAGVAVQRSLRRFREEWEVRLEIGSLIGVVSLVPLVSYLALDRSWDSGHMLMTVLLVVTIAGSLLVLLPRKARLAVISVLIVIHFGGITVAVVSVDPPGQSAPWISTRLWAYFYRPYLGFMYLGNAYHFYSPEPGPPTLVWSYILYSNGEKLEAEWFKVPDRSKSPVPLHHQRLLALTESTNQLLQSIPDALFQELYKKREKAGERLDIPFHPSVSVQKQFMYPVPYSQEMIKAFARHVARTHPHLVGQPEFKFHSVKLYRVIHYSLEPRDMVQGYSPLDKTLYSPFYQGEYDAEGNLMNPTDPFLYWMIPIVRAPLQADPKHLGFTLPPDPNNPDEGLTDYLEIHARQTR